MENLKNEFKREFNELKSHLENVRKKMDDELESICTEYFKQAFEEFATKVREIDEPDYYGRTNTFRNHLDAFIKGLSGNHNFSWRKILNKYDYDKQKQILNSLKEETVKKSTHMYKN
jgi:hypothetical protein